SCLIGFPFTLITSFSGSALTPSSVTTLSFTSTRPSNINCSLFLRDAIPACAKIFCSRSIDLAHLNINDTHPAAKSQAYPKENEDQDSCRGARRCFQARSSSACLNAAL